LAVGAEGTITFKVEIKDDASGTLQNWSRITTGQGVHDEDDAVTEVLSRPGPGPTEAPGPTPSPGAGGPIFALSFTKSVDQRYAQAGDALVYHLRAQNTGNGDYEGVEITDAIPTGTTYISGSATVGAVFADNALKWRIEVFRPGEVYEFSFRVTVSPGASGVIRNVAVLTCENPAARLEAQAETTVVAVSPVVAQPTAPVLIAAAPVKALRLPYTGFDLLWYLLIALTLVGTGLLMVKGPWLDKIPKRRGEEIFPSSILEKGRTHLQDRTIQRVVAGGRTGISMETAVEIPARAAKISPRSWVASRHKGAPIRLLLCSSASK